MSDDPATKPRRGRPRLVDRQRIIDAAKSLDPSTLTMQALAAEIGVDRKTLHYHVENRDTLLRMVAADAFRDAVTAHNFRPSAEWEEALRSFATITRDAVITAGAWASYVAFDEQDDLEAIRPAETAIGALVKAGVPEAEAGRVIATIAVLAFASARDRSVSQTLRHPQEQVLERALEKSAAGQFSFVRQLIGAGGASLGSAEQFQFEVDLVVAGVDRLIQRVA